MIPEKRSDLPTSSPNNPPAAAGTSPVLQVDRLSFVVEQHRIVDSISFDVQRGETIAITGKSGSGKTSLLRLLNRLAEPTSGTVYLNGQDYRLLAPRTLRQRVGMVTQTAYLFPGTVADNLRFGPLQRGERLADTVIDELLEQVDLAGYAQRDVTPLSGGEAQRVSVARTLANRPEVLLLDEPTSALDEDVKLEVEALLKRLIAEQSLTCLMITHDDQ
ncbi:MAG: ATP-binding cassette domain-containing protein [Anaerolineae bacterium]|nr:ATP-binding cassette domain-containing protein [Anaerolineae bacterium]